MSYGCSSVSSDSIALVCAYRVEFFYWEKQLLSTEEAGTHATYSS